MIRRTSDEVTVQPYSHEKSYRCSCKCRDCRTGRDRRGIKKATRRQANLEIEEVLVKEVD